MSDQKLKRSVDAPVPKISISESTGTFICVYFSIRFLALLTMGAQSCLDSEMNGSLSKANWTLKLANHNLAEKNEDLRQKLDSLQPDAITSASDGDNRALWITDEQFGSNLMEYPMPTNTLFYLSFLVSDLRYWEYPVCRSNWAYNFIFNRNEVVSRVISEPIWPRFRPVNLCLFRP